MHHDDSIQTVSPAGSRVLMVRCDESGRSNRADLAAIWSTAGARFVWLSTDGTSPDPAIVGAAPDGAVSATFGSVVDAVKRVADDGTIVETVDRSTLATVRPPALIPARVVDQVLAAGGAGTLLDDAVALVGVVELRSGA